MDPGKKFDGFIKRFLEETGIDDSSLVFLNGKYSTIDSYSQGRIIPPFVSHSPNGTLQALIQFKKEGTVEGCVYSEEGKAITDNSCFLSDVEMDGLAAFFHNEIDNIYVKPDLGTVRQLLSSYEFTPDRAFDFINECSIRRLGVRSGS